MQNRDNYFPRPESQYPAGIVLEPATGAASDPRSLSADALRLCLESSRSENSTRAFQTDLADFFRAQGETLVDASAVALLLAMDAARLTVTLRGYVTHLRKRKLSEATINRRLSSLRKLILTARLLGATTPDPKPFIKTERVRAYRNTRGPEMSEIALMLDAIAQRKDLKGRRDYALLLILATNGLRRGELLNCRISDFDRRAGRLRIQGKGRSQQEWVSLLPEAVAAIEAYFQERADLSPDSPLWVSCDHRTKAKGEGRRLTGRGFFEELREYGQEVLGRAINPHALRHSAITEALERTGGDIPLVQDFSRHARPETVMIYRHATKDGQGEVTRILGESLKQARNVGGGG